MNYMMFLTDDYSQELSGKQASSEINRKMEEIFEQDQDSFQPDMQDIKREKNSRDIDPIQAFFAPEFEFDRNASLTFSKISQAETDKDIDHLQIVNTPKKSSIRKPRKKNQDKKSDSRNTLTHILKPTLKRMEKMKNKRLKVSLDKIGLTLKQFFEHYFTLFQKIFGCESLSEKLNQDYLQNPQRFRLFRRHFIRLLRKNYMIYAVKQGKMHDINAYIEIKNKKFIYLFFSQIGKNKYVNHNIDRQDKL